jgi:hypothetical protein
VSYRPRDPDAGRVLSAIAEAMIWIGLIIGPPFPYPLQGMGAPRASDVPAGRDAERAR